MSALQALTDSAHAFQRDDYAAAREALTRYRNLREQGEREPITLRNEVRGDEIATAMDTLIRARITAYRLKDFI